MPGWTPFRAPLLRLYVCVYMCVYRAVQSEHNTVLFRRRMHFLSFGRVKEYIAIVLWQHWIHAYGRATPTSKDQWFGGPMVGVMVRAVDFWSVIQESECVQRSLPARNPQPMFLKYSRTNVLLSL